MPISRVMIHRLPTFARPMNMPCPIWKTNLVGTVVSIFLLASGSAFGQGQNLLNGFNSPGNGGQSSQAENAFELFGRPQNNFYDFAFQPIPEANQIPIASSIPNSTQNQIGSQGFIPQHSQANIETWSPSVGPANFHNSGSETVITTGHQTDLSLPPVPPIFAEPTNRYGSAGNSLLAPYESRAAALQGNLVSDSANAANISNINAPSGFRGWWANEVASPVGIGNGYLPVSVDTLIHKALQHSPRIQVAATAPHILQKSVFEAASEFDWARFLDTKYDSLNDPVGNTLTTGNNDSRFRQQEWYGRGGLKRKTQNGGDIEISQRLGHLDNNSNFLIPRNQGSSRLELNYRQPILNGRGRAYNQSLIVLADIDFRTASDEFLSELQLHLVSVTETYWELVRARAVYLQRKRLLQSAEKILHNLEGRSKVDSMQRQVLRAKAAVAQRRSEIARSLTSIKNAQSQLRLLVNSPDISGAGGLEFTPTDLPSLDQVPLHIDLADVMSTALTNRPDISRSIRDLHAANVRLGVARNEVLPKLDMIFGTYIAGLDGDSDIFDSFTNQFTRGAPGFNVGFEYELPIGNRAANARRARRQWEVTRSLHLFRQTVETSLTEVEVSAREVDTTYQEMLGRYYSMVAADRETNYLVDRWQTLPEANDSVTLLLEDLLDSQERLADEESAFVNAQVQYSISIVRLKQTMGTLFRVGQ